MSKIDDVQRSVQNYFNHLSGPNYVRILDTPHDWGLPFSQAIMPRTMERQAEFERAIVEIVQKSRYRCDVASLNSPDPDWVRAAILGAMDTALTKHMGRAEPTQFRFFFGQTPMYPLTEPPNYTDFKGALVRLVRTRSRFWERMPEIWMGRFYRLEQGILSSLQSRVFGDSIISSDDTKMTWNHSKIIAVDGTEALVGGHNLNMDLFRSYPPVHDVSVVVHGEAAYGSQLFLNKMWECGKDLLTKEYLDVATLSWKNGDSDRTKPTDPLRATGAASYMSDRQRRLIQKHKAGDGIVDDTGYMPVQSPPPPPQLPPQLSLSEREDLQTLIDIEKDVFEERIIYSQYDKFQEYKLATRILAVGKYWKGPNEQSDYQKASEVMKEQLIKNAKSIIRMSQMDLISAWKKNWSDHVVCHWIMDALRANSNLEVQVVVSPLDAGAGAEGDQYSFGSGARRTFDLIEYYMTHNAQTDTELDDRRGARALKRLHIAPFYFTDLVSEWQTIEGVTYKWPDLSAEGYTATLKQPPLSEKPPSKGIIGSAASSVINASGYIYAKVPSAPGNHAKIMIIDDELYVVGSDNLYPGSLSEFNYLVEGEEAVKELLESYWAPLWRYSGPFVVRRRAQKGGIGGYQLTDPRDQAFALDYTGSGKLDHLFFYQPGSATFSIVTSKQCQFLTVYKASDVKALDDRLTPSMFQRFSNLRGFAFDYLSQGRLDHVAFYAPGPIIKGYDGIMRGFSIIAKRHPRDREDYDWQGYGGPQTLSCDMSDPNDKAFAFDYGNGYVDHVVVYRPGTGKLWILGLSSDGFRYEEKWQSQNGIAGFDLLDKRDLGLAFDYEQTGRLDDLVFYRPGTGIICIIKKDGNQFRLVYDSRASKVGIGRWNLSSPLDRIIAFDLYDQSSEPGQYYHDCLVCYRPGTGMVQIIEKGYGGLELTAISWSNNLVTATTRTPHGVQVGQELQIGYVKPPSYNGTFQALAGTAGNTLVYALATNPGTATFLGTGGKISFVSTFVSDTGIGTYDLKGVTDQILAFDYKDDAMGKMAATSSGPSELFLFRPGSGVAFIARSIVESRLSESTDTVFTTADWYSGLHWPKGRVTIGVYRPSESIFYLRNSNSAGAPDITFRYGDPGVYVPIVGDWTGKGDDSIGVFRPKESGVYRPSESVFLLKNSNSAGGADKIFQYGSVGDVPIVGDWTGKGYDSIGVYRPSESVFYLRNSNSTGVADITFKYGNPGDVPIVGDWTEKGYDSIGVYRPSESIFYLRNSNSTGVADITFKYGNPGDVPIVGDWTGKGYDSIGVYRPSESVCYLRNSNSAGAPDITVQYAPVPVINYQKLEQLLAAAAQGDANKWSEADQETWKILIKVSHREKEGHWLKDYRSSIDVAAINSISNSVLNRIDQLWKRFSNGKFGFHVQKKIWQECNAPEGYSGRQSFGVSVGWYKTDRWIRPGEIQYNLAAPMGHLPASGIYSALSCDDWSVALSGLNALYAHFQEGKDDEGGARGDVPIVGAWSGRSVLHSLLREAGS